MVVATKRFLVGALAALCVIGAGVGCDDTPGTGGAGGSGTSSSTGKGTTTATSTTSATTTTTTTTNASGSSSSGMAMGAFQCLGDPLPTTAPATISLGGKATGFDGASQKDVPNATIELFKGAALAATVTTDGAALFNFANIPTSGTPVDGFLHATATNYLDTYVYPPYPLFEDTPNAAVLFVSQATLQLLPILQLPTQDPQKALVGILVVDCDGEPVAGATVSTTPAGTVKYGGSGGLPDAGATATAADGLAYVFNVPAGPVVVDALAGANDLRQHTVEGRAGVITTTIVAP